MQEHDIRSLLRKYIENTATASEIQLLLNYFDQCEDLDADVNSSSLIEEYGLDGKLNEERQALIYENIKVLIQDDVVVDKKTPYTFYLRIAAAIIVMIGIGYLLWPKLNAYDNDGSALVANNDIVLPDTGTVLITSAEGTQRIINPTNDTAYIAVDDFRVYTNGDGTIVCKSSNSSYSPLDDALFTEFTTLKGQNVKIILPDSSIVWLNANSKLRVNHSYNRIDRNIAVQGEAYFEVKHNKKKPFVVAANTSQIKVLGTEFNVSNRTDVNSVVTTLVKGAVKIGLPHQEVKLTVGEQAVLDNVSRTIKIREVNTADYTSWKEGYFTFRKERISQLLNRIDDWYDIQEINIPPQLDVEVSGMFERTKKLSDLLRHLEKITDLKFVIEQRKVYVR